MSLTNIKLEQSLKTGFIDHSFPSLNEYLPQLLVNDSEKGKKVLSSIIQGLNNCEEFWFSVAFVTTSGVATLIETLIDIEGKGIKGKILVSQYLNFTQPEALKRLLQFKNIEVKIAIDDAFHSKGYLFRKGDVYDLIVGSSNLTSSALCSNIEWNLKISATPSSFIMSNAIGEFNREYRKAVIVDDTFISNYEVLYKRQFDYSNLVKRELLISDQRKVIPNSMQVEALKNIEYLREQGKKKALLISATGTGKTYLSAFDVKKVNPKKFLFIVHRLNIAQAAMKSYKAIFGSSKSMGVYSGSQKEIESDFIFCTVQTLSRDEHLRVFDPMHFDYIVVDETHRAGADSYKKVLEYFDPKFLLGMTATPERTDGLDVFKLFEYNIAYEIRLHRALDENILSPFHYYGVTDISVDNKVLEENSDFNSLTADERIERIIEKTKVYGSDNGITRGLIFCSTVEESKALSAGFNKRGYGTISLSGVNSEEERTGGILKLESDPKELDYIFTVDIFNEGIDIPSVNQIIMLRPTQSAIIFVQQLGRGLRKLENKEYLTVIDFIGNYKNNFLVPIALYGDTTYNKDSLRKLMASGSSLIPGTSTVNFDRIAREAIFAAIDQAKMALKADLVKDYKLLRFKLGRIPMMMDFLEHGSRDPYLYVTYAKSYFNFVMDLEDNVKSLLLESERKLLEFFSIEINNAKRVEESIILRALLESEKIGIRELKEIIKEEFQYDVTDETIQSCIVNLNSEFIRGKKVVATLAEDTIYIGKDLKCALRNNDFRSFLIDNIHCSICSFRVGFSSDRYVDGFVRYRKYSRKDVCRILNWPNDISSTIYGYRTKNEVTPCFVTYHKSEGITDSTNYNDHFIDRNTFAWESRSNRRIASPEIQNVISSKRILLFIKKEDGEGADFYFMGNVTIVEDSIQQQVMPNSDTPIVHFNFLMDQSVEDSMFEYLTFKIEKAKDQVHSAVSSVVEVPSAPFRILPIDQVKPYRNSIPLFNTPAAAGHFIGFMLGEEPQWIELNRPFRYSEDYFVCQVIGESMNKIIPSNSWCLFKKDFGGSKNGKIVLVRLNDMQDSEFGDGYTVKLYESKKEVFDDTWRHESIILKPKSNVPGFENIVLSPDELRNFVVIGIFVEVLR